MSVHQFQTQVNKDKFFFLLANVSTLTANNISTLTLNSGFANITTINNNELDTEYISSFYINTDTVSSQNLEANFAFISEATVLGGFISSLTTNNILLDGNSIDTGGAGAGATLLLNGFPIVTGAVSSFSTLADWAYFPAASTLQMSMNSISNAGNIQCMNINSQNIYNALTIQTDSLSVLTNLTSPAGVITTLRGTNFSTVNATTSNLTVGTAATVPTLSTTTITGQVARIRGLSSLSLSTNTLTAGTINGQPYAPASNWSQYAATSAVNMNGFNITNNTGQTLTINPASNLVITTSNGNLVQNYPITVTAGDISMTADSGADVGGNATFNIIAQNGNRGRINMTANPGFAGVQGEVVITANGGSLGGVGFGGLVEINANTPLGFSNLTSAIKLNAAGINSYAGAIPSVGSLAGYNFIYGTLGVNIAAGLPAAFPNAGGTVYIYGTNGVEVPSQAYMSGIEPYWDGITTPPDLNITGRYILPNFAQVCTRLSNVRQIDFQSNVTTYMSNCDNIAMTPNGTISTSNLTATNATITTLSNTSIVGSGAGTINGYTTIGATNLNTSNINNIPIAQYLNQQINTFSTASISSATISSINNFMSFGTKSTRINGDVAQLQLYNNNPGGFGNNLNLLARVGYSEIQSFNSNFTTATNLKFRADNFGFNVDPGNIPGGIELDISGNTQIEYGSLKVGTSNLPGYAELGPTNLMVSTATISTINGQSLPYPYGSFTVNASQIIGNPNTAVSTIFDRTEYANGISIVGTSSPLIAVSTSGLYRWIASPQFDTSSGGSQNVSFWFQKNGSNIARSASRATVANNAELFSAVEIYEQMNAQDTLSFCFTSSDTNMSLAYYPASGVVPDNPALILNGNKIADI
jgi:hypothetical protein